VGGVESLAVSGKWQDGIGQGWRRAATVSGSFGLEAGGTTSCAHSAETKTAAAMAYLISDMRAILQPQSKNKWGPILRFEEPHPACA